MELKCRADSPSVVRRQRATFGMAMAFLLVAIVGAFFYEVRANDIEQLRAQEYRVCTLRNNNVEAIRDSLTVISMSTDTYTRAQILRASRQLQTADCQRFFD